MLQLPLNIQLDDSAKFDNFNSGASEQLVDKLKSLYSMEAQFIFVWGQKESGKTHLAQAICHSFNQNDLNAAYLPLENESLEPQILDGMSFMDLVCLDNIQTVIEDRQWEVSLFNLYNELKNQNKSLVIFCDNAPSGLSIELADLLSRLNAMEVYKLESLNDAQRVELFQTRAQLRGFEVSDEVTRFIFNRYGRSLTELITILEKLDRSTIELKRKVTIPLVKQILD